MQLRVICGVNLDNKGMKYFVACKSVTSFALSKQGFYIFDKGKLKISL